MLIIITTGKVAAVKLPQAVLPTKKITDFVTSLTQAYVLDLFCSDAIGALWRYRAEREVDASGVLRRRKS